MKLFKIIYGKRIKLTKHIISLICIFDFLYLFFRSEDLSPTDDPPDLV